MMRNSPTYLRKKNRVLYPPEQNFRKILKTHILKLLQSQRILEKKDTVTWTKLGYENTKFFHAAAKECYMINTITSLITEEGRTISDHQGKGSLLWQEYKDRLGCSNQVQMHFDLHHLI
jgi:hypothetical protein